MIPSSHPRHLDLSVAQIRGISFPHSHTYVCMLSRFSRVRLFATPWTAARQAPLSTGFSRQEHLSGLPSPPPGGLPDPGMEPSSPVSPALQAESYCWATGEAFTHIYMPSKTGIRHFTHAVAMLFLTSKPSHLCQEDWSSLASRSAHPLRRSLGITSGKALATSLRLQCLSVVLRGPRQLFTTRHFNCLLLLVSFT